jgi:hypothetical protein
MSPCLKALPSIYAYLSEKMKIGVGIERKLERNLRGDVTRSKCVDAIPGETEGKEDK